MMRAIFVVAFLFSSAIWLNVSAQLYCTDFTNAFKKKDTAQLRKNFKESLKYDSCTISSIDLVISSIAKGNVSRFNLICLSIIHSHADGYASEYLAESMNKIVGSVFRKFLRENFNLRRNNKNISSVSVLIDSAPFLKQDISMLIKEYISQLPASDDAFKKYLKDIISML